MDLNQEIRSFTPIDIEKFSQENKVSEKIVDSVKAYNKAIEYLRTGSEDIAMIELKRVVAVNPEFYEAVNLLGLCYAYTNQMDKAQELFGKVVNGESGVLKAADYLNHITAGDNGSLRKSSKAVKTGTMKLKANEASRSEAAKKETPGGKKQEAYKEEEVQAEYILFKKLGDLLKKPHIALTFNLFGIICLAAALVFFVLTMKNSGVKKTDEPIAKTAVSENLDKTLAENKKLQEQLDAANLVLKSYRLTDQLNQISTLHMQGKNSEAIDKLSKIAVSELNAEQKKKYDSIKKDVYLNEATSLYTRGNELYNSKKYAEAIEKLERVFTLGDKWPFGDKALYILGKSYVAHGDNQKGAEAYKKLIEQYPKSSYVKYARSRLNAIQ